MRALIRLPPQADPNMPSPEKAPHASLCAWLTVIKRKLQQVRIRAKHCLASCAGGIRPGAACTYTMLVASDIKKDAYGPEF